MNRNRGRAKQLLISALDWRTKVRQPSNRFNLEHLSAAFAPANKNSFERSLFPASATGITRRLFHYDTRTFPSYPVTVHPEDPDAPPARLKSPHIPSGHPLDTDGRPIGLFIPDYDIELPASSHRGFAKDFKTWVPPPEYGPRSLGSDIKYDYEELVTTNLPPVYEVNLVYVLYGVSLVGVALAIVGTHIETGGYYAKYGEFYKTGWPLFHYEPVFDIVPLTARDDGKPPESLRIVMHGQQL